MIDAFPLVEVSGTAYAMGYEQGVQLRDLVHERLALIESRAGKPPGWLWREAMHTISPVRDASPALVQELRGLADGAEISFAQALFCQMQAAGAQAMRSASTACAVAGAAAASGAALAGQNLDLAPEFGGLMLVLHLRPTDGRPRALILTLAGQLGGVGINNHGLAIVANELPGGAPRLGLPLSILLRIMLERRSAAECVRLAERRYVASSATVLICDGHGTVADLEIKPEGVVQREGAQRDWLVHANHFVSPDFERYNADCLPDSVERARRMSELLEASVGRATLSTLQCVLADHEGAAAGICRHGESGLHTAAGCIAEPDNGRLHVRRGYGCQGTWRSYAV